MPRCRFAQLQSNAFLPNPFVYTNGTAVTTKAAW